MAREYQIISGNTCLIKAQEQLLREELSNSGEQEGQALEYFLLAEKLLNPNLTEAVEAYEKSAAILPSMSVYLNWGNGLFIGSRTAEAHKIYSNGLTMAVKKKNRWFESAFLNNTAHLCHAEGKPDDVFKFCNEALPALKETGETKDDAVILLCLLMRMEAIYSEKKDWDPAIECLRQSLALCRETGRKVMAARFLNNLGLSLVARKDYDQALNIFGGALDAFRKLGFRKDEAEQLGNIGSVFRDTYNSDLALKHYHESLTIFQELDCRLEMANQLTNIGYILAETTDYSNALAYFEQAEDLYLELGATSRAELTRKNIETLTQCESEGAGFERP